MRLHLQSIGAVSASNEDARGSGTRCAHGLPAVPRRDSPSPSGCREPFVNAFLGKADSKRVLTSDPPTPRRPDGQGARFEFAAGILMYFGGSALLITLIGIPFDIADGFGLPEALRLYLTRGLAPYCFCSVVGFFADWPGRGLGASWCLRPGPPRPGPPRG
jgi:hypothetical protein